MCAGEVRLTRSDFIMSSRSIPSSVVLRVLTWIVISLRNVKFRGQEREGPKDERNLRNSPAFRTANELRREHARIQDAHVDPALSFTDLPQLRDKGDTRVVPRHVELHHHHLSLWRGRLDCLPGRLAAGLCAAGDDHVGAELGEVQGRRQAETRCGAREEDRLPDEGPRGRQRLRDEATSDAMEWEVEEHHGESYLNYLKVIKRAELLSLGDSCLVLRSTPAAKYTDSSQGKYSFDSLFFHFCWYKYCSVDCLALHKL